MATYLLLSTLTDEGRKTLKERPERLQEVNKEIETMGGRVVAQYATLGLYDFVNVVEAASNEVIARISVDPSGHPVYVTTGDQQVFWWRTPVSTDAIEPEAERTRIITRRWGS